MSIQVQITTSQDQDLKLERLLSIMNEQRIALGKPSYSTVNDMARAAMLEQLKGWYTMADDEIVEQFKGLFSVASDAERQSCMDILLPPIPEEE
jgi:hypothetical protein